MENKIYSRQLVKQGLFLRVVDDQQVNSTVTDTAVSALFAYKSDDESSESEDEPPADASQDVRDKYEAKKAKRAKAKEEKKKAKARARAKAAREAKKGNGGKKQEKEAKIPKPAPDTRDKGVANVFALDDDDVGGVKKPIVLDDSEASDADDEEDSQPLALTWDPLEVLSHNTLTYYFNNLFHRMTFFKSSLIMLLD